MESDSTRTIGQVADLETCEYLLEQAGYTLAQLRTWRSADNCLSKLDTL
jgi:hypothetical protein